eukprot:scaffold6569_cov300-Prasinococcus_capsulatus_cf.AAC.1
MASPPPPGPPERAPRCGIISAVRDTASARAVRTDAAAAAAAGRVWPETVPSDVEDEGGVAPMMRPAAPPGGRRAPRGRSRSRSRSRSRLRGPY